MDLFRVDVTCKNYRGAFAYQETLSQAVFEAVRGSRTNTMEAFTLGLIAVAIIEGVFTGPDADILREFLGGRDVPSNVGDLVALALGEGD